MENRPGAMTPGLDESSADRSVAHRRAALLAASLALPVALIVAGVPVAWTLFALPLALAVPLAGLPGLLGSVAVAACAVAYATGQPGADAAAMALGLGVFVAAGIIVGVAHAAQVAAADRVARLDFVRRLTALPADEYFEVALARESARHARRGGRLSLALIDLDAFTDFNRAYGASAGDRMIASVAEVIDAVVPSGDLAVRLGDGQFAILACCEPEDLLALAERIRAEVAGLRVPAPRGREAAVTVSAVVSAAQEGDDQAGRALLDRAGRALDEAKAAGRDRVMAFAPEHHRWISSAA